ncbi:transcription-repair coupling factor [Cyanobacterium aponinum UTEX 3222]|uniref:transcription-repair coupling factor n=1 Tax=Cyanobacterium aponinum TaxID=379064 RepID=UPI002B4BE5B0|nr:transcription-repair coupling factor [Cyanobacterium aponinum]WRL39266.1 transcription-repair coupling factor [Cyanobacterium aponinum UTEX 3221]WRL40442.1 transcription-repair coupling factor [Cyanobacterium aponinum UTEX 3222]
MLNSVIRAIASSPLTQELSQKLSQNKRLNLQGASRLPKGLVTSALAQQENDNLLVVCSTLEEAARWMANIELMGWKQTFFYPTSEASPYEAFDPESEMVWGQLQTLSSLINQDTTQKIAIVTTEKALQPHLPPVKVLKEYCLYLFKGMTLDSQEIELTLTKMGYERVNLVEVEGQWSKRGDLIDIFPVSAELPVRLEFFGDELEKIREFDPVSQRSLDAIESLSLTPTTWQSLISHNLPSIEVIKPYLSTSEQENLENNIYPEGMTRFLGFAFGDQVCSLLDYLPPNTIVAIDEVEQCQAHSHIWFEQAEEKYQLITELKNTNVGQASVGQASVGQASSLSPTYENQKEIKIHREFRECLESINYPQIFLSEIYTDTDKDNKNSLNLSSRPLPISPHQFAKLAEILRGKKEIYNTINLSQYNSWLVSAQPSRTVALLQEHDSPAQFIPNPLDFGMIEKLQRQGISTALKYSGQAELEGFILPTFRVAVVTDREFFGQHNLATPTYIRKRRKAASKQVDLDKLRPKDFIVHKYHGIGQFLELEIYEGREYLVIKYADGLLRVPADSLELVSRYRHTETKPPKLNKMSGKEWQNVKNKVKKSIKKLAVDLVKLYATRNELKGYAYPPDSPWQTELEDSFPYQATPDQLKAIIDVKRDLESDRPMDRLVCGDVGFGKTEVAIRSIFKVVTSGNKQVVFLAPTTILSQQHYHTLVERFAPYPINIGLLNRFRTASERKEIIQKLATGELDVVVGTQLLLSNKIKYKDLGLLVVDEEQRFGVNQKEKIKALKTSIDVLTLSATPIPRTLYMSISGVREMSLITTPPPSRRPIKTHIMPFNQEVIRTAIRNELDRGGQIFYVVPRIEGMEKIITMLEQMIPSLRIAIAHGQLDEGQLESTMLGFSNGEADLLLCTTIVESGLDIPRVNTIIVESAHKFGLSQLYQLRGRVGRSGIQAHAWLLYPNDEILSDVAKKRLRALQEFSQLGSGYHLAMRDMEIRGVGNLLGAEQSGQMEAIGFEMYTEMLKEAINEIQGQEIPQVEDTQIDLKLTALIPNRYIADMEQKMDAYRAVATVTSQREIKQIESDWQDRYGEIPESARELLLVAELKLKAKSIGFSRIKPEGKQNIIIETPMQEPAWLLLAEKLPPHLRNRFVYGKNKVIVRGLGTMKPSQQLENLNNWFTYLVSENSNLV